MSDESFSLQDERLMTWLHQVINPYEVSGRIIDDIKLRLNFPDRFSARAAWDQRFKLREATGYVLEVCVQGKPIHKKNRMTLSSWVNQNSSHILLDKNSCTVMVHSAQPPYNFLFIQPYKGIEEVVNGGSVHRLLGQPLDQVESVIAEAKQWMVREAIHQNGDVVHHSYAHSWLGGVWKMNLSALYLKDHHEVIIKTHFGEKWMFGFWDNRSSVYQPL